MCRNHQGTSSNDEDCCEEQGPKGHSLRSFFPAVPPSLFLSHSLVLPQLCELRPDRLDVTLLEGVPGVTVVGIAGKLHIVLLQDEG